ncbi:MAG: hypothetical protein U5K75_06150 [Ahrensia sp.]|nr:hypothetical protein [Ahrensia sp.]
MSNLLIKTSILALLSVSISGCLGPTYGTGKTAGEHLVDDLGGVLSLAPKTPAAQIDYKSRPDY